MSYEVTLPIFEGPLDLLLYLLRKNEVDIYDIPIAEITRQYLDALELMKALDLDASGEFLTMAATLLRIKSRMLLPRSEEEGEEEDPRRDLVLQLVEYRKFKEAARKMAVLEESQRLLFNRPLIPIEGGEGSEDLAPRGDVADLVAALQSLLARIQDERLYEIIGEDVSVEERMEHVLRVLAERGGTGELRFEELFAGARRRLVLIATFMAILELARQTRLGIRQEALFGEIWVRRASAA
jgi:segregation and condensation protein A